MDFSFWLGIVGSLVLVVGAAWPSPKKTVPSLRSFKDWLFAIGGVCMFFYAYLGYLAGGSFFFVILEIFVLVSTLLMMLDTSDMIDTLILSISGFALTIWSLYLFEGYTTLIFIFGLIVLGLGYAFQMGSVRRDVALTVGSLLLALFSYLEVNRIFFGLNVFFAFFSGYYLFKNIKTNFFLTKKRKVL